MDIERIKIQTQNWLQSVVIGLNICPFAQKEYQLGRIAYRVIETDLIEGCLETFIDECQALDNDITIGTSLLIYPNAFQVFDDYLDFLYLAETLLNEQGYEGTYQLASFHPEYCFEGSSYYDAANYTNRSPYPMLHLIREADIEKALKNFPNPEQIPTRNIELTRKLGKIKMQALLESCFNSGP